MHGSLRCLSHEYAMRTYKKRNKKTGEFINLVDNELTENITKIHDSLWNNYKDLNGTSAGFHGFSEYIVFSTFKNFIESLNAPKKFKPEKIFYLTKNI